MSPQLANSFILESGVMVKQINIFVFGGARQKKKKPGGSYETIKQK